MNPPRRTVVVLLAAAFAACGVAVAAEPKSIDDFEDLSKWQPVDVQTGAGVEMKLSSAAEPHSGSGALRIDVTDPKKKPWYSYRAFAGRPVDGSAWNRYDGIRFYVRGDGSTYYGSVQLKCGPDNGYEAFFPLADETWHKVTLRWKDFVQNTMPWDAAGDVSTAAYELDPAKVTRVDFGRGNYFFAYGAKQYAMELDDLALEPDLPDWKVPEKYSHNLDHTAGLLEAGKEVTILALGDSITWRGKDAGWPHLLAEKLAAKYGAEVTAHNRAIAGYSARGGSMSLVRDFAAVPKPDLVILFFGANDAKAPIMFEHYIGYNAQGRNLSDYWGVALQDRHFAGQNITAPGRRRRPAARRCATRSRSLPPWTTTTGGRYTKTPSTSTKPGRRGTPNFSSTASKRTSRRRTSNPPIKSIPGELPQVDVVAVLDVDLVVVRLPPLDMPVAEEDVLPGEVAVLQSDAPVITEVAALCVVADIVLEHDRRLGRSSCTRPASGRCAANRPAASRSGCCGSRG